MNTIEEKTAKVEGLELLGISESASGKMIYVMRSFGIVHELKGTQLKRDKLTLIIPSARWQAAFPSAFGPYPDWSATAEYIATGCMEIGEYKNPGIERSYDDWLKMDVGDWFYTVADKGVAPEFHIEKYEAISHYMQNSRYKPKGAEYRFDWLDSENRGKITRIK